jgi:hypothetical protein
MAFVKEFHTTGLVWNPTGGSAMQAQASGIIKFKMIFSSLHRFSVKQNIFRSYVSVLENFFSLTDLQTNKYECGRYST